MTIPARQWLAVCLALGFAACGGHATQSEQRAAGRAGNTESSDGGSAGTLSVSAAGSSDASGPAPAGSPSEGGTAGAREGPEPSAGGPSNPSSGGSTEPAGAGTAGLEAGAAGAPSPVIASGTHLCSSADDCVGPVECRGRTNSSIHVCLKGCATDADCSRNHRCVLPGAPGAPDAAGCFLRCETSPLICPYAFDCYDISGQQDYTCVPRQW